MNTNKDSKFKNIAIIGAGAIGMALANTLSHDNNRITLFSRQQLNSDLNQSIKHHCIDYFDERSIAYAAQTASQDQALDLTIVATGFLHDENTQPEKALQQISLESLETVFAINTFLPMLIAKYFIPKLDKKKHSIFAVLSARVGSISDNHLGGWYAYRASKAALNMMIKTCAIETSRKNKYGIVVGLHPGTVDSELSKPFSSKVAPEKLFTPEFSAQQLQQVLIQLNTNDSGKCFAWDGKEIQP